jgi:hypothetical protein
MVQPRDVLVISLPFRRASGCSTASVALDLPADTLHFDPHLAES